MGKKDKPIHILVIRLSAMGDVAMTIPILQVLVTQYPHLRLTFLTKKAFAPIFSDIPNVEVHIARIKKEHKGLPGLWRLYKELRRLDITEIADLHNVLRSKVLLRYFGLSGVRHAQIDKGRKAKKALTRSKNKVFQPLKTTHQRYADVFTSLGFPVDLAESKPLERLTLSQNILDLVGQDSKKWIGLAPFAAHQGKMYPLELTEEVVSQLNDTNKYKIMLFGGGKKEAERLERVSDKFLNVVNFAGKLPLEEELIVISNLDVMVSMDSGNAHLATNYGIPVITLWGVTHPYAGFYPFNQPIEHALLSDRRQYPQIPTSVYGNKWPKGYEQVMRTIAPQSVFEKIQQVLGDSD